jgi:hypothetical protein
VRIQSALLCDAATIENGKLFALGGGIATWWVPAFPAEATPMLAGIAEADPDLDQGEVRFSLRVQGADGSVLLDGVLAISIQGPSMPGVPWVTAFVAPLRIPASESAPVDIVLSDDTGVVSRLPLMILLRT